MARAKRFSLHSMDRIPGTGARVTGALESDDWRPFPGDIPRDLLRSIAYLYPGMWIIVSGGASPEFKITRTK